MGVWGRSPEELRNNTFIEKMQAMCHPVDLYIDVTVLGRMLKVKSVCLNFSGERNLGATLNKFVMLDFTLTVI